MKSGRLEMLPPCETKSLTRVEKGIRGDYIVLVGGAPLNEAFAENIGADAYCRDAAVAVETAKEWMSRRQGSAHAAG